MPQSHANIPVHLVFSTKHRLASINPEIKQELYPYMTGILRNLNCQTIQVGGVEDHIHILFRLGRTISIAQLVEKAKSSSTKWIKEKWPTVTEFAWQAGYGSFGVGIHEVSTVQAYIQNQVEHHKKISFKEEFLSLLIEHGLEYDERYLWE